MIRETRSLGRPVVWDKRRAEHQGIEWGIVLQALSTIHLHQMAKQLPDYPLLGVPTIKGALPPRIIKERLFIANIEAQITSELSKR